MHNVCWKWIETKTILGWSSNPKPSSLTINPKLYLRYKCILFMAFLENYLWKIWHLNIECHNLWGLPLSPFLSFPFLLPVVIIASPAPITNSACWLQERKRNDGPNPTYPPFGSLSLSTSMMKGSIGSLFNSREREEKAHLYTHVTYECMGPSYPSSPLPSNSSHSWHEDMSILGPWVGAQWVEWWRCSKHVIVLVLSDASLFRTNKYEFKGL